MRGPTSLTHGGNVPLTLSTAAPGSPGAFPCLLYSWWQHTPQALGPFSAFPYPCLLSENISGETNVISIYFLTV